MNLTQLLDRPIAYHRVFVTLTGSVKAAILLSQALYWQKRARQADGWWYKTAEEWQDETGLTRHEQDTAREACKKYLKTKLKDAPARLYWNVDERALSADLFALNPQTSLTENGKLDSRNSSTINKNTETTTETTTKNKDILDGILHFQVKPSAIKEALKNYFKLTPNWETKFNREFLQWAIQENASPEQIKHAAQVWGKDKRFNWSHPNLKGIQEHWLQLIEDITPSPAEPEPTPEYLAEVAALFKVKA